MKKTLGIIFGGQSSEYEVSLKSVTHIINCLKDDFNLFLIGITRNGEWFEYCGAVDKIINDEWLTQDKYPISINFNNKSNPITVTYKNKAVNYRLHGVFPVLHGKNGEDGSIQGLFQLLEIPLFGCQLLSSAICMDKDIAHRLVSHAGINVTKSLCIRKNDLVTDYQNYFSAEDYPLFVKPANEGSSCGMSKVTRTCDLKQAVEYAFLFDSKIVIEKNVIGFEVGCSVMGNDTLYTGCIDEVELHMSEGFFDYNEKYTQNYTTIHPEARLNKEFKDRIEQTAIKIYTILECTGLARIDLFVHDNEIYFNEVNTIPGLTAVSRFPQMIKHRGLSFQKLLVKSISEII